MVFRCANEPSILALLRAVKLAWTGDVVQETSDEGDTQSNGAAESSINVVKGHVRSIKLAVEPASGVEVPADHDLLTWLVSKATSMHRRFSVGRDGKTADERNVGRRAVLTFRENSTPVDAFEHNSVSECGGCLCSHPTVVWILWIHDLSKEGSWDRWMDRTQCLLAQRVVW